MNVQGALKGQYRAAMGMLRETIEKCPPGLWAASEPPIAFWRVVYHTLFFTHLYLQPGVEEFRPWVHHREEQECLGPLPWPPHRMPKIGEPYTREQMLAYWTTCDEMVAAAVDRLDLSAGKCGFPWYPIPKLDHQITNIRHIQHHAAVLSARLRYAAGVDIEWR